ncbi:MAG TPA: urea ABC transporter permease subunit UrtB, partial [Segetibacter sp.]|nr:urea ABC transporter permease subunit UrtB [Segetibacter sp.]
MIEQLLSLLINGLSIASILLLTALGLSIAFGMMGIINFAHGEFIMIGSYATYLVGIMSGKNLGVFHLIFIFILAFVLAGAIGFLLEKTIIKHLYGRPIYSILATWGISLILQQLARNIFGANNVEASIPKFLNGGVILFGSLQVPYNRLFIFLFTVVLCVTIFYFLYRTSKGRMVQAVMQNRDMAACMGIKVRKVDALTFSIGCGIAGLAGVCISMLGSIGPSTGQNYIMDAFLVVILGGVGGLRGTIIGAILVGLLNPYIEVFTSASTAKVILLSLVFIVLQLKP